MPKEFDKPVPCPKCGKLLDVVQVERATILEWYKDPEDEEDEGQFTDNGQGSTTIKCYLCGCVIGRSDANGASGIYPASGDY